MHWRWETSRLSQVKNKKAQRKSLWSKWNIMISNFLQVSGIHHSSWISLEGQLSYLIWLIHRQQPLRLKSQIRPIPSSANQSPLKLRQQSHLAARNYQTGINLLFSTQWCRTLSLSRHLRFVIKSRRSTSKVVILYLKMLSIHFKSRNSLWKWWAITIALWGATCNWHQCTAKTSARLINLSISMRNR